jgi:hypothetical protein
VWLLGGRRALHAEQRWPYAAPAPDSECERLHGTRELHRALEGGTHDANKHVAYCDACLGRCGTNHMHLDPSCAVRVSLETS